MRKIHIFDREGRFIRTLSMPTFPSEMLPTNKGQIVAVTHIRVQDRQNFSILILNAQGEIVKTIAEFPGLPVVRGGITMSHDYSPTIRMASRGEDGFVYGCSPDFVLILADWSGNTTMVLKKDEAIPGLTRKEKDRIIDDHIASMARYGENRPRNLVEKAANLPEHRPFFDRVLADDRGRIWVRKLKSCLDESDGWEFDIFGPEGTSLYRTRLPFSPRAIRAGCMYHSTSDADSGDVNVVRTRINNWGDIKTGDAREKQ